MTDSLRRWLSLRRDLDSLHIDGAIYAFALRMAFGAIILSLGTTLFVLPALHVFGWLPFALDEAIQFGVGLSWLVCGPVSGLIAWFIGQAVCDLAESRAKFQHLSRTDALSGLLNRRAFGESLSGVNDDASLVIFDLDRFKTINDGYGHSAGDMVIRHVAAIIGEVFGERHAAARLGGEEFGVLIVGIAPEDRRKLVESVRSAIASRPVLFEGHKVRATISAGIADIRPGRRKQVVYAAADKALYRAKAAGRDRVVHESEGDRRDPGFPDAGTSSNALSTDDEIHASDRAMSKIALERSKRRNSAVS